MWPLWNKQPELITVTLSPGNMSVSWISWQKNKKIEIHAYQNITLKNLEFEKSILFNLTKMSQKIKEFIKINNIAKAAIALSISEPNIFEKIINLSMASPVKEDFKIDEIKNLNWKHTYIGPSLHNGFDFYVCGIKRELIFQCNLLAIKSGTKPLVITTAKVAHIKLYKYLQGEGFSQSKLAIELSKNYDIGKILLQDQVKKIAFCPNIEIDFKKELPFLSTNIGLFLLGKNYG